MHQAPNSGIDNGDGRKAVDVSLLHPFRARRVSCSPNLRPLRVNDDGIARWSRSQWGGNGLNSDCNQLHSPADGGPEWGALRLGRPEDLKAGRFHPLGVLAHPPGST